MPGAFELDHLQPFKLIIYGEFFIFLTFILGCQLFLPQRANTEKREFSQVQKLMRHRCFSAWGIQTGPFAAIYAHFVLRIFRFSQGVSILGIKVMQKRPEKVGEAENGKAGLRAPNMQIYISSRISILLWLCDGPRGHKLRI